MKLELAQFPVKEVEFGRKTEYEGRTLRINKDELLSLVLLDKKIAVADLDVALPGEKTRIVNGRDAVEPMVKVSGPGCVFPGILGPVETVGEGRTHRLPGVTVIPAARYQATVLSGTGAQNTAILDMWGEGAERTPFGSSINIVLTLKLIDGISEWEAHMAIQLAEFKVATRLAETTRGKNPENVNVFELFQVDPSLPRVVYVLCCITEWGNPHASTALYGYPVRESMPTYLHPNEFFDGAVTTDARRGNGGSIYTWGWMNHPIILGLLRDHGKRLNFLGVIFQRTRFETEFGKRVTAAITSQMERLLGANGAIFTRMTESGNNLMDVMLTLQASEKKGIKTLLVTPEYGGGEGVEPPLVFHVPEATAMVSTGSSQRGFKLSRPTRVIGVEGGELVQMYAGDKPFSPWEEITRDQARDIFGGVDWFGGMNYTCKEY